MRFTKFAILLLSLVCLTSCGDDDKPAFNLSELYGYWTGQRSGHEHYVYVTFKENKTGEFTYESPVYHREAGFTYDVSDDKIICKGIIVGQDGVVNDFNQTYEWHGTYLAPVGSGAYSDILLYKNGNKPVSIYVPEINLEFSLGPVWHFKDGTYNYTVFAIAETPAGLWENDVTQIGAALNPKNATIDTENGIEKLKVNDKIWPCLHGVIGNNQAQRFSWPLFFESKQKQLTLEYLPFYGVNSDNYKTLGWKTVTLTPTKISEDDGNGGGSGSGSVGDNTVTTGTTDGHEWVDLGLPSGTLWATCNVGASSPSGYGNYYAWGETTTKSDYSWETYKYCKKAQTKLTKYCTSSSYGTVDNKTELEPTDDAATANWGSNWQMPSKYQQVELYNSNFTTTTWTTQGSVYGRLITSKSNDNSIFLPATGYRSVFYGASIGEAGGYWSRSLGEGEAYCAGTLGFDELNIYYVRNGRNLGQAIRPVRKQ